MRETNTIPQIQYKFPSSVFIYLASIKCRPLRRYLIEHLLVSGQRNWLLCVI